jgi:hypothetical protein
MVGAAYHQGLGWEYRGGGFARQVTDEGWKKLAENQQLVMKHALYAWVLQPRIGGPPWMMQTYALTDSDMGTPTDWFLRTIAVECDDFDAYSSLGNALKPRWGGSLEQSLTFAKSCLRTFKFDSAIPQHGLEMLIRIQQEEMPPGQSIFDDPGLHESLLEYAIASEQAIAAAGPTEIIPAAYPHNRSALAALLALSGDITRARAVQLPAAHAVSADYYRRLQLRGDYAIARMMVDLPELSEPLQRIDQVVQKGVNSDSKPEDLDAIQADLQLVRQAFALPNGMQLPSEEESKLNWEAPETAIKEWAYRFVMHTETIVARMRQFAMGQPVDLTTDKMYLGWDPAGATWQVQPPDAAEMTNLSMRGQLHLLSLARFEPP